MSMTVAKSTRYFSNKLDGPQSWPRGKRTGENLRDFFLQLQNFDSAKFIVRYPPETTAFLKRNMKLIAGGWKILFRHSERCEPSGGDTVITLLKYSPMLIDDQVIYAVVSISRKGIPAIMPSETFAMILYHTIDRGTGVFTHFDEHEGLAYVLLR